MIGNQKEMRQTNARITHARQTYTKKLMRGVSLRTKGRLIVCLLAGPLEDMLLSHVSSKKSSFTIQGICRATLL